MIVATMSPDEITPNAAPRVAHAIGAERAAAFDIGAACTGFLAGLAQAAAMIEVGRAERILLIGAEKLTRITDFDDKKTGMLFGDGAGAVVLGPTQSGSGIGPIDLSADGGLADTIVATPEDPFIRMDGISTFKIAIKRLSESTIFAVSAAGLELDDIDLFVYHQANSRILKAVGERLELDPGKVADYIAQLGNTSAASIPLTLSLSREDGRLRPGHKVLRRRDRRRLHVGRRRDGVERILSDRPENAVALVTGASKGIGSAIAKALAADGWVVAVNYRSDEAGAKAAVEAIEEAGGKAKAFHADVTSDDPKALLKNIETELGGPVLALVNNAGVARDGLAVQLSDDDWDTVIATNLSPAFRLTRDALRSMMKARYGRVVNIASVVGPRANVGQSNYAAAKAGLIGMTKTIAAEVARRGVTVNAVAPGFISTDMTAELATDEIVKAIPARRQGTPEEVAAAVRFLASADAGYVTGTTLYVDGGMSA